MTDMEAVKFLNIELLKSTEYSKDLEREHLTLKNRMNELECSLSTGTLY